MNVDEIIAALSTGGSTWNRANIVSALCDVARPDRRADGERWAEVIERAVDQIVERCVELDPDHAAAPRRRSDGRSMWLEPTSPHITTDEILREEELVLAWALDAQADDPTPSDHRRDQQAWTCCRPTRPQPSPAMTGSCSSSARPAPARPRCCAPPSTTSTPTAARCSVSPRRRRRPVSSNERPASRLTRSPSSSTNGTATTGHRCRATNSPPARPCSSTKPAWSAPPPSPASSRSPTRCSGASHSSATPTNSKPSAAAACSTNSAPPAAPTNSRRSIASPNPGKQPRPCSCDAATRAALDAYIAHGRVHAAPFDEHIATATQRWLDATAAGEVAAVIASTNQHVDALNAAIQRARHLDPTVDRQRSAAVRP